MKRIKISTAELAIGAVFSTMTNDELGRRLVACKRWRWMPGMLAVAHREQPLEPVVERMQRDARPPAYPESIPDLTDPATLGCLLALVREAWGDDHIVALNIHPPVQIYNRHRALETWAMGGLWCATVWDSNGIPTEVEALVVALEAAP